MALEPGRQWPRGGHDGPSIGVSIEQGDPRAAEVYTGRDVAAVNRYESWAWGNWQRLALYLSSLPTPRIDVPRASRSNVAADSQQGLALDGDYAALICSYPWPCAEALGVVYGNWRCPNGESGGDPNAQNGDNWGIYQINGVHAWRAGGSRAALLDPAVNVRVAFEIWSEQGWAPWACRP